MEKNLRKIIHVDMDAYYASVESLDNPDLKGKPLVVGGLPNTRSVVCTASYEARKFGIHSAMSCRTALRLCPQVIFVPPRFDRYTEISQQIRSIFARYTTIIEPLSLDEAYLDVTEHPLYASEIARAIQQAVWDELTLSCSVGVGPNKLIAKIASDYRKPKGITIVRPHKIKDFMQHLSVRKIHGVGPATEARLKAHGLILCQDLWQYTTLQLTELIGNWGEWLWHAAQGEDDRPVKTHWERKSYGREDTFEHDIIDEAILIEKLSQLASKVSDSLRRYHKVGKTITLKVKYDDFKTTTRCITLPEATDAVDLILEMALTLLKEKTKAGIKPVRLLGISVSKIVGS